MISTAIRLVNIPFTTWIVLALPAPALLADLIIKNRYYAEIMYESGLLACQLMILALAISPLMQLFRNWPMILGLLSWMQKRRRYFGVAAFGYATIHMTFYLREVGDAELIWLELEDMELTTGWMAFAVLSILAATSNNWSLRKLGKMWKPLQKTAYLAGTLSAIHWWLIGQFQQELFLWFMPLALLQVPRLVKTTKARMAQN